MLSLYPDHWLVKPLNSFYNPNKQIIHWKPVNINYSSYPSGKNGWNWLTKAAKPKRLGQWQEPMTKVWPVTSLTQGTLKSCFSSALLHLDFKDSKEWLASYLQPVQASWIVAPAPSLGAGIHPYSVSGPSLTQGSPPIALPRVCGPCLAPKQCREMRYTFGPDNWFFPP